MPNKIIHLTCMILLIGGWYFNPANADVYKWKDAEGKIHFGDQPPIKAKSEKLEIDTQDKGVYQPSGDYRRKQEKLLKVYEEERKVKQVKQAEVKEKKRKLEVSCKRAKKYEARYERASRFYREKEDGTRIYMSDEERKLAENGLQSYLKRFCDNKG